MRWFVIVAILLVIPNVVFGAEKCPEFDSLMAFANAAGYGAWLNNTNWGDDSVACSSWYGLTTDSSSYEVTAIKLSSNGLSGTIASSLGDMKSLDMLLLDDNKLIKVESIGHNHGPLRTCDLRNNDLTGTMPGWVTQNCKT